MNKKISLLLFLTFFSLILSVSCFHQVKGADNHMETSINNKPDISYELKTDYTLLAEAVILFLLILSISVYWNRKLSKLNKQLQIERDKATKATKVKSDFLANMSHEIRTPMNSIVGMSHLVLQTRLNEKQKEYIEKIDESTKLLLNIINEILDFSKIEAGKLKVENITFNLRELINRTVHLMEFKIEQKSLILEINNRTKKDLFYGDPLRLSQILTNLLSNAVKFTPEGKITLNILPLDNGEISFEVIDTGIGIEEEKLSTIFESFTQADNSISRKYGGTGLGLAISKELVHLMNGNIKVSSKKGEGSCFSFHIKLPAVDKKDQTSIQNITYTKETDYCTISLKGENVLIAQNDDNERQLLIQLLENLELNVQTALNGAEMIEKFNENKDKYKFIIIDLQIPLIDGIETAKIIRKIDKDIPIIALSANNVVEDKQKTCEAEINEYLIKPLQVGQFYSSIFKQLKLETSQAIPEEKKEIVKLQTEQKNINELFTQLKRSVKTQRPKKCQAIICEIENYHIKENEKASLERIKKEISSYKFKEALKILEQREALER